MIYFVVLSFTIKLTKMADQMRWTEILKPEMTMLKFRPPYVDRSGVKELEYLPGDVYFQVWEGCTSSETRLIVRREALGQRKTYDCVK